MGQTHLGKGQCRLLAPIATVIRLNCHTRQRPLNLHIALAARFAGSRARISLHREAAAESPLLCISLGGVGSCSSQIASGMTGDAAKAFARPREPLSQVTVLHFSFFASYLF